ncbi:DNA repair protein RecN (Recombination protein N) [Mitsuaria sp. BK045]|uniref:DNA repair protein RecN n=1 Tax=unclassified Roseateles TaxID=2626991 RepID=UPI00161AACAF|nr:MULTISPECIES: DNA repair protein RecN [unclassified Roseateles]MBB3291872.1 DNA repair protein RecN (Recombination protein N) [Mitsuaria sp. BK041]MBB3361089.1 DNA repair protein RecN (Recombination protein N) [Mitsuaria sp. BK045]
MLRRLSLKDFVIVPALELDFAAGFSALTGETGAGKSILIDALQLALGSRGDAAVVREGATRAEISAEFDRPAALAAWLEEAGFDTTDGAEDTLLLRRVIDAQGKSRAWINGGTATVAQLRELAEHLLDIHGQHAWQGLTRPASVRELLDSFAQIETRPMAAAFTEWRQASEALGAAQSRQADLAREHERLSWQIGEVDRLAPGADEWDELNAEHQRLSHAQSLMDAARGALERIAEAEINAESLTDEALSALQDVLGYDAGLQDTVNALLGAQAQLQDAAHSLGAYLHAADLDPDRLRQLDDRLSAWVTLARRYRRQPAELPALLAEWKTELAQLDAASDLDALQARQADALKRYQKEAKAVSTARAKAAPALSNAVSQAMQQLGMAGGRFEVALLAQDEPQGFGMESAEFLVAGHAGSTPRPLAKVASGGELSRIALAIAVTTSQQNSGAGTLIFDEIDAGVGGAVAETVGRLMKQLGQRVQVLAVTHLPQVAACADHHFLVAKALKDGKTNSEVRPIAGEARTAEIARMLGGERLSSTSLAHAQEMLDLSAKSTPAAPAAAGRKVKP